MKIIIAFLLLCVTLTGCASPLAKLSIEEDTELKIDIRDDFDPKSILSDIQDDVKVNYDLDEENSKLIIKLEKDDKVEIVEKDITILYPLGELNDKKIIYYTYKDFNKLEYIDIVDGVDCQYDIDFDNKKIIYFLTKGDRNETITADIEIGEPLIDHELHSILDYAKEEANVIKLDDVEYYIFKQNNNEALLLSVEPIKKMAFNEDLPEDAYTNPFWSAAELDSLGDYDHNSAVDKYESLGLNVYDGSSIDNYLENDFYQNMSNEVKDAIIEKEIQVTVGHSTFDQRKDCTLNRHVYIGDMNDWIDTPHS